MIITCPNCQARYEVASQAIGNAGRKVQCASCQKSWKAVAEPEPEAVEPDKIFSPEDEQALDAAFQEAERALGAGKKTGDGAQGSADAGEGEAPTPDKLAKSRQAMKKRHHLLTRNLPRARMRRLAMMVIAIMVMTLLGGGLFLRDKIVMAQPDLAGLYGALGLSINVVGLEFREVQTVKSLRDGSVVMNISAMLENVSGRQVAVPPVLVSLVDEQGVPLYEWSVSSPVVAMGIGEWMEFETQLAAPPKDAVSVRLSFVNQSETDQIS